MKLRDWFQYSDREKHPYNPTTGTTITIERFWRDESSEFDAPEWRREEWLIHSALVPVDQLNTAAAKIPSPDYLTFEMGWDSEDQFSFGDYSQYGDIQLYALSRLVKHPVSQDFSVELSREFIVYHALQKRNQSQHYHPIDNILVAETNLDSHEICDPTAKRLSLKKCKGGGSGRSQTLKPYATGVFSIRLDFCVAMRNLPLKFFNIEAFKVGQKARFSENDQCKLEYKVALTVAPAQMR